MGLQDDLPIITLGEGKTPLVEDSAFGQQIFCKLEYLNPTGSYKDRASAVLVNHLVRRGITSTVEDSSGNAGASFAAYAARAGIQSRIFVPEAASGPKRQQIELYGAELVSIKGPRSAAADAVKEAAKGGVVYASHAYLPFGMDGIATIAYEIYEALGTIPGSVICPVGHGSLLLGILRGFKSLQQAGLTDQMPKFVGVQAQACAPVWYAYNEPKRASEAIPEGATVAEGVRVRHPVRGSALVQEMRCIDGEVVAIQEEEIIPSRDQLARRGYYVEPTSALVWAALKATAVHIPTPVVLILSGTGYKFRQ